MNADVYADTAQGVVGTNMFAYCNNSPVMFVDPEGTTPKNHQPLGIPKYILAFAHFFKNWTILFGVTTGVLISLQLINEFSKQVDEYVDILFANLTTYISSSLATLEDDLQEVMTTMIEKLKKLTKKPTYKKSTETHHICAKGAIKAFAAKSALYDAGLTPEHESNLIDLYTIVHKRLHTIAYYAVTNKIVVSSSNLGFTVEAKRNNILLSLGFLKEFLTWVNDTVAELFPDLIV